MMPLPCLGCCVCWATPGVGDQSHEYNKRSVAHLGRWVRVLAGSIALQAFACNGPQGLLPKCPMLLAERVTP